MITAISGAWVAFGTPTYHQFAELLNQKTELTLKVDGLKKEEEKAKSTIYALVEEKKYLVEQNSTLSKINKKMMYQTFFQWVDTNVDRITSNPVISLFVAYEDRSRGSVDIGIKCAEFDESVNSPITPNCWSKIIQKIMKSINEASLKHGRPIGLLPFNVTMERVFIDAIQIIEKSGNISKEYTSELRTKVNNYIQDNPDSTKILLNINLTTLDMQQLEIVNNEVKKLFPILRKKGNVGEKMFNSIPEAEVFKLEQYIDYIRSRPQ